MGGGLLLGGIRQWGLRGWCGGGILRGADGCDGVGTGSAKSRGDMQSGTAATAVNPVVEAGDGRNSNGADGTGASVGAGGGCGVAALPK